jgi:ATP-dependent Clp protease ATP-binding subunit ClpC
MTSNLGTEFVTKSGSLGFLRRGDDGSGEDESHDKIERALKATFSPEFLNRVDEIITFKPLSLDDVVTIVDLQMKEIQDRLAEHGLAVQLTDAARQWLAKEGFEPQFGARPLRRALQKYVESPLSVQMLRGEFKSGDVVTVDYVEGKGLEFHREEVLPVKVEQPASVSQ